MVEKFFFLSGLPRSGSTLLTSLLSQNPDVHSEGSTAVCQLMWDAQQSCRSKSFEALSATGKFEEVQYNLCSTIPFMYYHSTPKKYIVDKCRAWPLTDNMQLIKDYITSNPKIVILVRPVGDVVNSFLHLKKSNGEQFYCVDRLLEEWSEPLIRPYNAAVYSKNHNNGEFLFVDYDRFIATPQNEINRIYNFFGLPVFNHSFSDITNQNPEDDSFYGVQGFHEIRSEINKRDLSNLLSEEVKAKCDLLTMQLYENLDLGD